MYWQLTLTNKVLSILVFQHASDNIQIIIQPITQGKSN